MVLAETQHCALCYMAWSVHVCKMRASLFCANTGHNVACTMLVCVANPLIYIDASIDSLYKLKKSLTRACAWAHSSHQRRIAWHRAPRRRETSATSRTLPSQALSLSAQCGRTRTLAMRHIDANENENHSHLPRCAIVAPRGLDDATLAHGYIMLNRQISTREAAPRCNLAV